MRWLINYIRSLFCKHEWEFLRKVEFYEDCNTMPSKLLQKVRICPKNSLLR